MVGGHGAFADIQTDRYTSLSLMSGGWLGKTEGANTLFQDLAHALKVFCVCRRAVFLGRLIDKVGSTLQVKAKGQSENVLFVPAIQVPYRRVYLHPRHCEDGHTQGKQDRE